MRQWLRKHRRLLKWSAIIIAASWLLNFLFLGVSIDDFFIRGRVANAKANWEANGTSNYHMIIDVGVPLSMYPTGRISMTVKDGVVVTAEQKDLFDFIDRSYDPDKVPFKPIDPQKVSYYTMDNLFEMSSQYLENDGIHSHLSFEFSSSPDSYIKHIVEECGTPLLYAKSECGFFFKILEFEPLE
jgi:hypothetical protein